MPHWQLIASPNVPGGYTSAILLESVPFIDPTKALPYLVEEFIKNGGTLRAPYKKIVDLDDFINDKPEEIVFNCSGLGARGLLKDKEIKPMRGQIVVVNYVPNWDWSILGDDGYYVFPRMNETILGGTTEEDVWDERPEPETLTRIFENAKRVIPELTKDHISRAYAGLRPYRVSGVRVEAEKRGSKVHVVNVGFGGSGWTFCWGAAEKAITLAVDSTIDNIPEATKAV